MSRKSQEWGYRECNFHYIFHRLVQSLHIICEILKLFVVHPIVPNTKKRIKIRQKRLCKFEPPQDFLDICGQFREHPVVLKEKLQVRIFQKGLKLEYLRTNYNCQCNHDQARLNIENVFHFKCSNQSCRQSQSDISQVHSITRR